MVKKGPLHIVYIITKLELGGAQKVCLSLFHELEKKEHTACLISGTQGPLVDSVKDHPRTFLLPLFKRDCSLFTIFHEITLFFQLTQKLKALLKTYPDLIVHTHSTKAGYLGRWAAFCARVPQRVHTVHGFGFHEYQSKLGYGIAYLIELITCPITSHYICVSEKDRAIGTQKLPSFSQKSSLIRAAVDDAQFIAARSIKPSASPFERFVFGTVSCFKEQKNIFDVLKSFYIVYCDYPHAKLEIIGDGILRPAIESWIKEHNLQHAIKLHGWQQNIAPIVATWQVFVLSSLWEGLPCSIVEARFLKIPVICYNVGGINEVIKEGKNGFLCDPKNTVMLAHRMKSLLTTPALYKQIALWQEDLSDFTLSSMIAKHIALYQSLQTR